MTGLKQRPFGKRTKNQSFLASVSVKGDTNCPEGKKMLNIPYLPVESVKPITLFVPSLLQFQG